MGSDEYYEEISENEFKCLECGKVVQKKGLGIHRKKHERESNKKVISRENTETTKTFDQSSRYSDFQDEELEEILGIVKYNLEPVVDKKDKLNWFVNHYLAGMPNVTKNCSSLLAAIARTFPKIDQGVLELINQEVLEVQQSYRKSFLPFSPKIQQQSSFSFPQQTYDLNELILRKALSNDDNNNIVLFEKLLEMRERDYESRRDYEKNIEKLVQAQKEMLGEIVKRFEDSYINQYKENLEMRNEFMKQLLEIQVNQKNTELQMLKEMWSAEKEHYNEISKMQRKWNDDTNQLIAQLSDNISKLYSEGRAMRMNLLEHILVTEEPKRIALTKKEETSKEILSEVEKE